MFLTPLIIWWFATLIFGLVGWLLAFSLLRHLPDRGFAFARPVGILITGYILWLGGTFRLLQNNIGGVLVALILALTVGLIWRRRQTGAGDRLSMLAWLRREWRYALGVELLFHLSLIGWTIFKAYNPNIETAGGEKWMEITFINGTLRSDYFPPQDPWLSGFAISYYYFGYLLMAMLTRLTHLISTVAFNLYIPTLFAMTLTAALGIGANLVSLHRGQSSVLGQAGHLTSSALLTGSISALFVAILGNLEGLLEVLHKGVLLPASFWIWLDIRDLKIPPTGSADSWIPDRFIWWWRASRVLTDYTLTGQEQEVIDEFPFFSFLLGDVHPHVLALPFVLLVIALALNLLANKRWLDSRLPVGNPQPVAGARSAQRATNIVDKLQEILQNSWRELTEATGGRLGLVLYAICLGGLSFLNTWDFPIYLSVVGLAFIAGLARRNTNWESTLQPGVVGTGLLGLMGVILYLPFYATFQSQARGILPNLWNPTRLPQFIVFFGPFLVAVIVLLIILSRRVEQWQKHLNWSVLVTVLGPVLAMLVALSGVLISPAGRNYVQGILSNPEVQQVIGQATVGALVQRSLLRRVSNPWTFLLVGGLLGWTLALFAGSNGPASRRTSRRQTFQLVETWKVSISEKFVLILLLVGLGLPLAVEFIYLRDNFGIRMNTVFKFYFQAWVLLALASAFAVYYVSKYLHGVAAIAWYVTLVLVVAGGMVYPLLATPNKADFFQSQPTLDGIAWISNFRPGDYAAIRWLRQHAPDSAVILEAPAPPPDAYQYTSRVSALTGLPTLLGWGGHQGQWRGNYDEAYRRVPDIDLLYNTSDIRQAQMLLDQYGITYVYVGSLERERYSPQGLKKFERFMEVVFQQDDVTIYQRR